MQILWKILLTLGIIVVFAAFVMALLDAFYKSPRYEDYFKPEEPPIGEVKTQEECEKGGGKWYPQGEVPIKPRPAPMPPAPISAETPVSEQGKQEENMPSGWCDVNFTKQQAFDAARKEHDRNSFVALIVLGASALVGGAALMFISREYSPIGGGFGIGGAILMLIGIVRFWDGTNAAGRVLLLGAVLLILVGTAVLLPKLIKRLKFR